MLAAQRFQQVLRDAQIRQIDTFIEAGVRAAQQFARLGAAVGFVEQARQAHGGAQLPPLRTLSASDLEGLTQAGFGIADELA